MTGKLALLPCDPRMSAHRTRFQYGVEVRLGEPEIGYYAFGRAHPMHRADATAHCLLHMITNDMPETERAWLVTCVCGFAVCVTKG